jgi:hypothetical protein
MVEVRHMEVLNIPWALVKLGPFFVNNILLITSLNGQLLNEAEACRHVEAQIVRSSTMIHQVSITDLTTSTMFFYSAGAAGESTLC